MSLSEIPSDRELTRVGNSWGGTVPKEILEEFDLLDDNGEPSAVGTVVFDDESDRVGVVFEPE